MLVDSNYSNLLSFVGRIGNEFRCAYDNGTDYLTKMVKIDEELDLYGKTSEELGIKWRKLYEKN